MTQSKFEGSLGRIFFLTNSKGVSVIFLIIAMLLMVILAYVFSYLIPTKQKSVVFSIQSTQAFFLAQSGVEFAVRLAKDNNWTSKHLLNTNLNTAPNNTGTFGTGTFTLTYTSSSDTLTSVGYVPTGTQRREIVVSNFSQFVYYFAYHKTITVQAGEVSGGPLTNFPMLVSFTDANLETVANGGHVASYNCYNGSTNDPCDLVFLGLDDTTCGGVAGSSPCKLNHEIELYNSSTGQLVAWVKVPSINNGTIIYMYYGNSCMTASSQNATGVWDANYQGVWHLSQSPTGTAPQMKDSTANGYNGTAEGGFVAGDQQTAKIDGGLDFESAHSDYVQAAAAALGTTSVTVSAWFNVTSFTGTETTFGGSGTSDGMVVFSTRDANTNVSPTLVVSPALNGGGFGTPNSLIFCDDTANVAVGAKGTTAIATGTWYYAVGTFSYNAGTATYLGNWNVYLNGQNNGTTNNFDYAGTAAVPFSGASWMLGNNPQWTGYSNVILDEVRVSNIARSAAWILTEYNNQNNPGSLATAGFYAVGAEQNN
jgi:hypothetical protein